MSCFSAEAVFERDLADELQDQLQSVQSQYTNASYPSIVGSDGMLVASLATEDKLGIDLTATIAAVQSAARHFTSIVSLTGCKSLRITGDNQIFMLFSLRGDNVLVFFHRKDSVDASNLSAEPLAVSTRFQKTIDHLNDILLQLQEEEEEERKSGSN
mmetsp:Transcript_18075/g.30358  ORF Transcript_18075/g.30358 Transcript_18075/m.30358 type:complete len:157 (+) Transcript_18075:188-658(+)|eukprot:CAMPEP_0174973506 /NCGR_PEP_ID=MMETSP0004_2-20121128/11280_1 /TAXON_ID=420556 /ORGANISM="Ochromonas sp., Strain CCMP1393" /LENGTH=156 /DNA_ID=CAMNT_0016223963 /DNA_START=157 /DNA_END=627 /DNA_ORIENTATION=+